MESVPSGEDRSTQADGDRDAQARLDHELIEYLKADKIADVQRIENLEIALQTARRIGAAMGIIMAARRCTEDEAFEVLHTASQKRNRKLRLVADEVVETGVVPDYAGSRPVHET